MTYIKEFRAELTARLIADYDEEAFVNWVCEKMLESYKNGITAGRKGENVIRKGTSRSREFAPRRG